MKVGNYVLAALAMAAVLGTSWLWAEETKEERIKDEEIKKAPIVGLDFFKDGTVLIKRKVTPEGEKTYLERNRDSYIAHGTFFSDSLEAVSISSIRLPSVTTKSASGRKMSLGKRHENQKGRVVFVSDIKELDKMLDWLKSPEGADMEMTMTLPRGPVALKQYELSGTVVGESFCDEISPEYVTEDCEHSTTNLYYLKLQQRDNLECTVLELESGARVRIPNVCIRLLAAKENPEETVNIKDLWLVRGATKPFIFQHLSKGIGYATSYRLDLNALTNACLSISADIRNDLEDFENAEMTLISGSVNLNCQGIRSLLELDFDLDAFLGQFGDYRKLGVRSIVNSPSYSIFSNCATFDNSMVRSKAPASMDSCKADAEEAYDCAASGAGETFGSHNETVGSDMCYQSVGSHSMKKGEVMHLSLDRQLLELKRYCEMFVNADSMKEGGAPTLWDLLKFKNPYGYPLTAGPVAIIDDGRIASQENLTWLNPGQEKEIKLTKSMTVTAKAEQQEKYVEKRQKKTFKINGEKQEFEEHIYVGRISLNSYRNRPADIKLHLSFHGVLGDCNFCNAKVTPAKTVRTEINDYQEKLIELTIPAKGSLTLEYEFRQWE